MFVISRLPKRRTSLLSAGAAVMAGRTLTLLAGVCLCAAIFVLIKLYGRALRDARYLDGWILAGGMVGQLALHAAIKTGFSRKLLARIRRLHIFTGYVLIAAFASHTAFSLPDTKLEWLLWSGFAIVTASGILGTYLARLQRNAAREGLPATVDGIAKRRDALMEQAEVFAARALQANAVLGLPKPPQDAWIAGLYANHLASYFGKPGNAVRRAFRSKRQMQRIMEEIADLTVYADTAANVKLAEIRALVIENDRLNWAALRAKLTIGWMLVHVPITYGLVVLGVFHIIVVYSFSSGAW